MNVSGADDVSGVDAALADADDLGLETEEIAECEQEERGICVDECVGCTPEAVISGWAGVGAVDCGMDPVQAPDLLVVGDCIPNSFEAGVPFHGVLAYFGDDSLFATGWALGLDGVLRFLRYDSSPCGGAFCGDCMPSLAAFECSDPSLADDPEGGWSQTMFNCGSVARIVVPACVFEP